MAITRYKGGKRTADFDRIRLANSAWDDLKFPATAINPPGQAEDPDFDTAHGGWLFDAGGTETVYVAAQLPHAWRAGTTLKPHVHWTKTTSASGNVRWQLRYYWWKKGEVVSSLATINATTVVAAFPDEDTADQHLLTALGDMAAVGYGLSDMLTMRLERVGGHASDTYGADARLLEFDIHYEIDGFGSENEYTKA